MKKRYLLLLLLFYFIKPVNSQVQLSVYSEVSIVTAGPGTELFESFGHSAIRIKDPVLQLDLVYNYGMFDWKAPNFYLNFVKGRPKYSLARYDFKYFLRSYKNQKRWVKQQVLNLNQKERQAFFQYLEQNALPKNASYVYDPYYNNCATKLREITDLILGEKVQFNDNHLEKNKSLRQLMGKEISWNTWGSLGINIALGSKLDLNATAKQYMYLPDYVYSGYKNAKVFVKNEPIDLIKKEISLLNFEESTPKIKIFNPFLIFSIISIIGLLITFNDFKKNKRTQILDFILFFSTGIIGLLIVFLWFFTDHVTAPNNFNFLWAFAPNFIIAFFLLKEEQLNWIKKYLQIILLLLFIIPIVWLLKIQQLPISIIPLLILLFVRYLLLSKKLLTFKK